MEPSEVERIWKSEMSHPSLQSTDESKLCDYEKERLAQIAKNKAMIASLGLDGPMMPQTTTQPSRKKRKTKKSRTGKETLANHQNARKRTRSSRRLAGQRVNYSELENANPNAQLTQFEDDFSVLLDHESYCELKGITPELVSDGHFTGWVKEEVRKACGIAGDSTSAWESNGGGKFKFQKTSGTGKHSAKELARKNLRKNPNQYFYRHCAPGVQHWKTGQEWTEEERKLFLKTAKAFGVGDKWGLFATYIPHRVGYQCSQYYRHHFVANGIIVDPNFAYSKSGEVHYVGRKGSKR